VLIALGAEKLVEDWHWHVHVNDTRVALTNELEPDALFATERIAIEQCLRDRITHLVTKLNQGDARWTSDAMIIGVPQKPIAGGALRMAMPPAYRAPQRPWVSDECETAKSTGVVDHMDREDVHKFEFIYRQVNLLRALQDEETSTAPQLSFLSYDQELQPQARVQAMVSLGRLDALNSLQALVARQVLSGIGAMRLPLNMMQIGRRREAFAAFRTRLLNEDKDRYGPCVTHLR